MKPPRFNHGVDAGGDAKAPPSESLKWDGKRRCRDCRYVLQVTPRGEITGTLACRRMPPAVIAIPVADRFGNVSANSHNMDRPVGPDYWCHEFEARLHPGVPETAGYELAPMDEENANRLG